MAPFSIDKGGLTTTMCFNIPYVVPVTGSYNIWLYNFLHVCSWMLYQSGQLYTAILHWHIRSAPINRCYKRKLRSNTSAAVGIPHPSQRPRNSQNLSEAYLLLSTTSSLHHSYVSSFCITPEKEWSILQFIYRQLFVTPALILPTQVESEGKLLLSLGRMAVLAWNAAGNSKLSDWQNLLLLSVMRIKASLLRSSFLLAKTPC